MCIVDEQADERSEGMTPEDLIAKYQTVDARIDGTLLKGIDAIDWSALYHAHGTATDVPPLLRAAVSSIEHDREFAFILLHETIWHQGSIYQATGYVVPILLQLLVHSETPDKDAVRNLLHSIATGVPG